VQCATVVLTNLSQQPFNVAFGLWWLMNPPGETPLDATLSDKFFGKVPDCEKLMKPLTSFADFDVYHLFKGNVDF